MGTNVCLGTLMNVGFGVIIVVVEGVGLGIFKLYVLVVPGLLLLKLSVLVLGVRGTNVLGGVEVFESVKFGLV